MKRLALLVLAVQLLALAPTAQADAAPPGDAQLDPLALAWLAGLDGQGELPAEMSAAPRSGPSLPPALNYEDAHPACDLDGDGVRDLVVNELKLATPPNPNNAPSQVRAVSGADGHELWKVNNLRFVEPRPAGDMTLARTGRSQPSGGPNVEAYGDANDDGVCDVFAYGYQGGPSTNLIAASIAQFRTIAKVLDGKTGKALWTMDLPGQVVTAQAPTTSESRLNGTPTGFFPFLTPTGPKLLVKTTDFETTSFTAPLGVPNLPILRSPLFKGAPQYRSVRIDEHISLVDGKTGKPAWTRDILQAGDAKFTNVTFFSGVGQLVGDESPDVLLDQFVITNPRSNELNNPIDGSTMYRYGRGARAMALDGAKGDIAWTSLVLDPLPVAANPPAEENKESVVWTRATVVPDLDGDGKQEVVASYLAAEESLGRTLPGAIRTHFVGLHGANGTKAWDVRQQGWGVVVPDGGRYLAFGTVDIPQPTAAGQRFPPKSVRLGVLDGADGSTVWSYEKLFAQNSFLSYNLALAQFETALTAGDVDKDGRLDLVTPAQYAPATGNDQVLLSTSSHSYQLLSGLDGATLQTYDVWGPQGRVLACGGNSTTLTVVSGHGRRVDLTRLDLATAQRVWRRAVFNDPAPHAATSAVDVETFGGACGDGPDGRTLTAVNLQLVSGQRGREVVPLLASTDTATGAPFFLTPALRGDPSTSDALLRASVAAVRGETPKTNVVPPILAGAALGVGAGVGGIMLLRKGVGRVGRLLAVALGLIVLAGPVSALALPGLAEPGPAPGPADDGVLAPAPVPSQAPARAPAPAAPEPNAPTPLPDSPLGHLIAREHALGSSWSPAAHVALLNDYMRASGVADVPEAFDANASLFYTHPTSDLDGDDVPDLIVDDYCVDFNLCPGLNRIPDDAVNFASQSQCGDTHHAYAFSSRAKTILWDLDLFPQIPWGNCAASYVLGTPKLPDGTPGLLVYQYVAYGAWASPESVSDNTLLMLDARTGKEIWRFQEMGTYGSDFVFAEVAKSYFLDPVLATDANGNATLLVQGVGYQTTAANTIFGVDPFGLLSLLPPVDLVDSYTPIEWAASIDIATGAVQWRVDTFTDVTPYNVFPRLHDGRDYGGTFMSQLTTDERYWGATPPMPNALPQPRAFDVTGDGVPDLIYHVTEWSRTPWSKAIPPLSFDARLVVIDGKDGKVAIDRYVEKDLHVGPGNVHHGNSVMSFGMAGPNYVLYYEPLGDVDHDGVPEMVQHEMFGERDFRHVISVVSGKDGKTLWNLTYPRDVRTIEPGDADGDGAPDILFIDWFSHEAGGRKSDDYDTPGALPVIVRSGATGKTIWRATTYAAPADAVWQFISMRKNGNLDVNADGVLDVPLDAPEYLGDQSVIHHIAIASGKDGSPLQTIRTVGAFGVVASVGGDATGDARPDYAVLSGDAGDLWLTLHDGATGAPLWSHRALQLPTSSYTDALPKLALHALRQANGTKGSVVMDLHMLVRQVGFFDSISVGDTLSVGTFSSATFTTTPQLLAFDAGDGRALWGLPDPANGPAVLGATPGTKMYDLVLDRADHETKAAVLDAAPVVVPGAAAFAATFPVTFGAGVALVRFARRFEGVPDLV